MIGCPPLFSQAPEEIQPPDEGAESARSASEIPPPSPSVEGNYMEVEASSATTVISDHPIKDEETENLPDSSVPGSLSENLPDAVQSRNIDANTRSPVSATVVRHLFIFLDFAEFVFPFLLSVHLPCTDFVLQNAGASVQVLKKPSRAFGALLGSSGPKRRLNTEKKVGCFHLQCSEDCKSVLWIR